LSRITRTPPIPESRRKPIYAAVATTPGDLLPELMERHEQHTGAPVATAIADGKYGTIDNLASRCLPSQHDVIVTTI